MKRKQLLLCLLLASSVLVLAGILILADGVQVMAVQGNYFTTEFKVILETGDHVASEDLASSEVKS